MTDTEKYKHECYDISEKIRRQLNVIFKYRGYSNFADIPVTPNIAANMDKRALELAIKAHAGQVDKGGVAYIHHPMIIGNSFTDPLRRAIGYLHDTIEDTPVTAEYLRAKNFDTRIVDAVVILSRSRTEDYFDYILRAAKNPYAADIKLADLFHNSRANRLTSFTIHDVKRMQKYYEAMCLLGNAAWGCPKK